MARAPATPRSAARGAGKQRPKDRAGRGGAALTADELFGPEGYFEARLLASAMGLPLVCSVKKCRRRGRCFGLGIVCLEDHAGLAKKRFPAAIALLGWEMPT